MSDTHRDLVAAGYLRRGWSRRRVEVTTGLSGYEVALIAKRLRIADDAAARTTP